MVLGVCRRVLPNFPDAEDDFQATFLLLATNVTLGDGGLLGRTATAAAGLDVFLGHGATSTGGGALERVRGEKGKCEKKQYLR